MFRELILFPIIPLKFCENNFSLCTQTISPNLSTRQDIVSIS